MFAAAAPTISTAKISAAIVHRRLLRAQSSRSRNSDSVIGMPPAIAAEDAARRLLRVPPAIAAAKDAARRLLRVPPALPAQSPASSAPSPPKRPRASP